ncbi:hypothetical protein [Streptomyces sp. P3]|nr:hypothetical protein [Streptomyces sp. P3]
MTTTRRTPPPVTVVIDRNDDALHTHTARAAHDPAAGRMGAAAAAPPGR